eukprot:6557772-Heterocapsa_arctica.AAC.1
MSNSNNKTYVQGKWMSKLGAVYFMIADWNDFSDGHCAVTSYYTFKVQTKGNNITKQLGHTLGNNLLNKDATNWLDEIDGVAEVACPHKLNNNRKSTIANIKLLIVMRPSISVSNI